jgi:hypothetical protein
MMKLLICIIILFSYSATITFAKESHPSQEIFYILNLQYNLENGRPVSSSFLCKDLKIIDSLRIFKTQKEILCWFYGHALLYQEPPVSVSSSNKCYSFKTRAEKQKYFEYLYKKLKKINKSYYPVHSRMFPDVKNNIVVSCVKLSGKFCVSDTETTISDQVYSGQCSHESLEYNLMEIFQFWKLTEDEKKLIRTNFQ